MSFLFQIRDDGAGLMLAMAPVAVISNATTVAATPITASVPADLASPSLTFIGSPGTIALTASPETVQYALQPSSGIEAISGFQYDLDQLDIDLLGAANSVLQAADTTVNGAPAISLCSRADQTHGVVLLGMTSGQTAVDLLSAHATFSDGNAIIT